jgi:hypothetical protein
MGLVETIVSCENMNVQTSKPIFILLKDKFHQKYDVWDILLLPLVFNNTIDLNLLFLGGFCLLLMNSSFGSQTPFQSIIQDNFMKVHI